MICGASNPVNAPGRRPETRAAVVYNHPATAKMIRSSVLQEGARRLGLGLSAKQERQFNLYQEGLAGWNRQVNLTSKTALAGIERVHFLDSLALVPLMQRDMPNALSLVDVGAGAGFPGVPVKLALPDLRLTLVEATSKKADFLRWLVAELGLSNVDVVAQRAEQLAHVPGYREAFDVATARALGPLAAVLELTLPFCRMEGMVMAPRAGDVADEVTSAAPIAHELGGHLRPPEPAPLPASRKGASIVLADKVAPTSPRYPRRAGLPAHRPLRVEARHA